MSHVRSLRTIPARNRPDHAREAIDDGVPRSGVPVEQPEYEFRERARVIGFRLYLACFPSHRFRPFPAAPNAASAVGARTGCVCFMLPAEERARNLERPFEREM